jgi:hypothetical protein
MKRIVVLAAALLVLAAWGCEKKNSREAYNKELDGPKGLYLSQPDNDVLKDQASLSKAREAATRLAVAATAPAAVPASAPGAAPPASEPATAPAAP